MLVGLSGPTITLSPGDEHDFPQDEAMRFVAAGFAVLVAEQIERAVQVPVMETRDPLDHDGNGKRGGSLPGEQAMRAKGRRKKG